uniref:MOSC domain-containing protein n=1 Tax=Globodera rostochiensis TaxID=31243 RepID=A0A914H0P7_GLORO
MEKSAKDFVPNSFHYLDFAGAALPTPEFLQRMANSLADPRQFFLANPHSGHLLGRRTRDRLQFARAKVLAHFGINDSATFSVIFTANATNSLKLLAENFVGGESDFCGTKKEFSTDVKCLAEDSLSTLLMLRDSHTSVVGMRHADNFERIVVVQYEDLCQFLAELQSKRQPLTLEDKMHTFGKKKSLFVMTAMSNFCGRVYDMTLARTLKRVLGPHWFVCFDSAALAPHSPDIGLSLCDFAVISFYKMFGYPTGIGALIVRRSSVARCLQKKRYFGGGTVKFVSPTSNEVEFRSSVEERFEDGTCNFYAISALLHAFEEFDQNDFGHAMNFAEKAFDALSQMKHPNGAPIAIIYGKGWTEHQKIKNSYKCEKKIVQGPIVNFNLLREDGTFVGFVEVDKMADLFGIQLRTGCHCNFGACSMHLGITAEIMDIHHQNGKECGDDLDLFEGNPLGSVRISFGFGRIHKNVDVTGINFEGQQQRLYPSGLGRLSHLFVYPIKSCAAMAKKSWPLCPTSGSLLFDRHWMIVSCGGDSVTQKRCSALCSIVPEIDAAGKSELVLKDRRNGGLPAIRMATTKCNNAKMVNIPENSKTNGVQCLGKRMPRELMDFGGESLSLWLSELDASLEGSKLICCAMDEAVPSNFSNKANFLLITRASASFIASHVSLSYESVVERFRPNFVVDFGPTSKPFEEDQIAKLAIGSVEFLVVGSCQRCQMICIDQQSGEKDPNVLIGLRDLRSGGKLSFGIYLERNQKQIGDEQRMINNSSISREMHTDRQTASLSQSFCQARSILWTMLMNLHEDLSRQTVETQKLECRERQQVHSRVEEEQLIATFQTMSEKLRMSEVPVYGREVSDLFAQIDSFLATVRGEQRQYVMSLEAYNSKFRLEKAMEREGGGGIECSISSQQMGKLNNAPIQQFVDPNVLNRPEIQKRNKEYFEMYYFKINDLHIKADASKASAEQIPKLGHGFSEAFIVSQLLCDVLLQNFCLHVLSSVLGIRRKLSKKKQNTIDRKIAKLNETYDGIERERPPPSVAGEGTSRGGRHAGRALPGIQRATYRLTNH